MVQNLALPLPGQLVGRKYRIMSRIGAGGMGVVFEAVHTETEGRVALKWLNPELSSSPEAVERFKLEARATGRIRHPNVVAIHDIGEHEGALYLVMELLMGVPLRTRISQGTLDVVESCRVLFPVMRGVSAAHALKILHRDLKPDNIFLAESPDGLEPVPKVLDFGIAKLCSDSERTGSASARTAMMGTYQYMALEQLHGRRDLDERVDVYALGAVLYNMLTGRLPYHADNPVDLALQMLQGPPEPVSRYAPGVPAGMAEVIAKALTRDREQRYASVDAFAADLEPFSQGTRYKGRPRDSRSLESGPVALSTGPGAGSADSGPVSGGGPVSPRSASEHLNASRSPASVPPLRTPFDVSSGPTTTARTSKVPARSSRTPMLAGVLLAALAGGGYAFFAAQKADSGVPRAQQREAPDAAAIPAADAQRPRVTTPISPGVGSSPDASATGDDWAGNDTNLALPMVASDAAVAEPPAKPELVAKPRLRPGAAVDAGVATGAGKERRPGGHRSPESRDDPSQPARPNPPANNNFGGYDMTDLPAPSWANPAR